MNLLFLSSRLPYPPFHGDRPKIYHILRILSRKHQITLLSLTLDAAEDSLAKELAPSCQRIETIILTKTQSYQNLLPGIFSNKPFPVSYYHSPAFQQKFTQILPEDKYDLIHTHLIRMAPYGADLNIPKVLDLTDAISEYLKTCYETTSNPIVEARLFTEWQRMLRYEPILEKFDTISVCSEPDRDNLLKTAPTTQIEIIRNGIDIDYFKPDTAQKPEQNSIIFTGNMTYAPNEDGLMYFYREILPLIRQSIPDVKLYIVGKDPSAAIQKIATDRVIVTAKVPDLRTYYRLAQVSICPIRFGAGTLNKVIEPMAMGIPVVSTSITGITEIEILNSLDYFTINEIFGSEIYYANNTPQVFLDLGSNIGCSELYFLSRNNSNIVYGCEPVPRLYNQLNKNINSCKDRVHNQNVAISDVDGEVSMGIEDSGRYGGIGVVTGENITVQSRNINTILQEIFSKHEYIDIVKIDIEGVEQTVINAIDKEYLKRIKLIYVEAGDEFIYPDNLKDCFKAINHRGICNFVNNTCNLS